MIVRFRKCGIIEGKGIDLQENDGPLTFINEGFQNGSISMGCFQID